MTNKMELSGGRNAAFIIPSNGEVYQQEVEVSGTMNQLNIRLVDENGNQIEQLQDWSMILRVE